MVDNRSAAPHPLFMPLSIRHSYIALAVVMLLGLGLRLVNLEGRTTEYDEIVSILFARADLPAMVRGTAADTMPPLYYALLHLWHRFTPVLSLAEGNLAAARLPSVLFGTATIPLVYGLGSALLDRRSALLGALVLAVSPFHIFYSQFARMYALLGLLTLAGAYFLVRSLQRDRFSDWTGFVLAQASALHTHNLAVVNLIGLDLAALILLSGVKNSRRTVLHWAGAHVAIGLFYLPWLTYLPEQLEKVQRAFWIPQPGLAELVRTPVYWLFNLPAPGWLWPALLFWTVLLLAFAGLQILHLRSPLDEAQDELGWIPPLSFPSARPLWVLAGLAAIPVAIMFLISQVRPIYVERGVMMSSVAMYLVIAWGVLRITVWPRAVLAAGSVALLTVSLGYYYQYAEFPRSLYREAAEAIAATIQPGEFVLHDTKLSFFPIQYFRPDLPQGFIADPPGSPNDTLAPATMETFGLFPTDPDRALPEHQAIWFVVHQRALDEAAAAGVPHAHLQALSDGGVPSRTERVGDLVLFLLRRER